MDVRSKTPARDSINAEVTRTPDSGPEKGAALPSNAFATELASALDSKGPKLETSTPTAPNRRLDSRTAPSKGESPARPQRTASTDTSPIRPQRTASADTSPGRPSTDSTTPKEETVDGTVRRAAPKTTSTRLPATDKSDKTPQTTTIIEEKAAPEFVVKNEGPTEPRSEKSDGPVEEINLEQLMALGALAGPRPGLPVMIPDPAIATAPQAPACEVLTRVAKPLPAQPERVSQPLQIDATQLLQTQLPAVKPEHFVAIRSENLTLSAENAVPILAYSGTSVVEGTPVAQPATPGTNSIPNAQLLTVSEEVQVEFLAPPGRPPSRNEALPSPIPLVRVPAQPRDVQTELSRLLTEISPETAPASNTKQQVRPLRLEDLVARLNTPPETPSQASEPGPLTRAPMTQESASQGLGMVAWALGTEGAPADVQQQVDSTALPRQTNIPMHPRQADVTTFSTEKSTTQVSVPAPRTMPEHRTQSTPPADLANASLAPRAATETLQAAVTPDFRTTPATRPQEQRPTEATGGTSVNAGAATPLAGTFIPPSGEQRTGRDARQDQKRESQERAEPMPAGGVTGAKGQAAPVATTAPQSTEPSRDLTRGTFERVRQNAERLAAQGGGTARMRINDTQLGQMDLEVRVGQGNTVHVEVKSRNSKLRNALEERSEELKDNLGQHKLQLAEFKVVSETTQSAHTGTDSRNSQPQDLQQNGGSGSRQPQSDGERSDRQASLTPNGESREKSSPGTKVSSKTNVQRGANGSLKITA